MTFNVWGGCPPYHTPFRQGWVSEVSAHYVMADALFFNDWLLVAWESSSANHILYPKNSDCVFLWIFLTLLSKSAINIGLFLDFLVLFYRYKCLYFCQYCTLLVAYFSFLMHLEISSMSPSTLFFFFKIVLAILGSMSFYVSFRISLSVSAK